MRNSIVLLFPTLALISCASSFAGPMTLLAESPERQLCNEHYCNSLRNANANVWKFKGTHLNNYTYKSYDTCPIDQWHPTYYVDYKCKKDNLVLDVGDFVVDNVDFEVGLLLYKFNLVDDIENPIYAWDIIWSGSRLAYNGLPRRAPYTEESLKNMIIEGVLTFHKNN